MPYSIVKVMRKISDDELPSEFIVLNKAKWITIKQKSGSGKGKDPVVLASGYVYAGKEHVGKECRLFVEKNSDEAGGH